MRKLIADRQSVAILLVALMLTAACGSTVQAPQATQLGDDELGDLSTGGALPPGATINDKGQVVSSSGEVLGSAEDFGVSVPDGANGGAGPVAGGTNGGTGGTVGGSGGGAALGPGVTSDKIYLGIVYLDAGAANQALAGQTIESDARKAYDAMIEEVNKAGGLGGREVVPIYHKYDADSSETIAQQAQAACARFTQDNKVYAILAFDNGAGVIQECVERAGAVQPVHYNGGSLPEDFRKYPHYVEITGMNALRVGPVTVTGLKREGYFDKGFKLGIVTWDDAGYKKSVDEGYIPALAKQGIELSTEPAYISPPQTYDDLAAMSADINNAILRFQSQGITHVIIAAGPSGLCGFACMETVWFRRAESQNYRPRYGLNDNNLPTGAYDQGLYPAEQLRDAVAVGWADLNKASDEGTRVNQARESCFDLMRKKGVPMGNVNQENDARQACDELRFLQLIVNVKLDGVPRVNDQFIAAVNTLGTSFPSTAAYGTHFSAAQHDGIAAARNLKFLASCDCWRYTTDPYRV